MIEITAVGMGMMMSAVAVGVGGLMLNATLLILGRALRAPPPAITRVCSDPFQRVRGQ